MGRRLAGVASCSILLRYIICLRLFHPSSQMRTVFFAQPGGGRAMLKLPCFSHVSVLRSGIFCAT